MSYLFRSCLFFSLMVFAWQACKSDKPSETLHANDDLSFSEGYYYLENSPERTGDLQLVKVEEDSVYFQLMVVGGPPAHNQGFLEGAAVLSDGVAVFQMNEYGAVCKLQIQPLDSISLKLETLQGDAASCGFGSGVVPDGVYQQADSAVAQQAEIDPAKLNGTWRSTIDPTYELAIADGRFAEYNRGEKLNEMTYDFFKECPGSCWEGPLNNCLRAWNEQDTLCYVVLRADLKNLEMSLIGGTGQSLVYERLK